MSLQAPPPTFWGAGCKLTMTCEHDRFFLIFQRQGWDVVACILALLSELAAELLNN